MSHSPRCYRSLSLCLCMRLLSRSFPYCALTLSLCLWSPSAPARCCSVGTALLLHAPCRQPSDIACCVKSAPQAHGSILPGIGWMRVLMMTIYALVNVLLRILFELSKKSGYYKNTVFLLFGDHNGRISPYKHMTRPDFETGLGVSQPGMEPFLTY